MTAKIIDLAAHRRRTGNMDVPSLAMRRWLEIGAAHRNGLLPKDWIEYHAVSIRTKRACEWRGWVRKTQVGRDEGAVGAGLAFGLTHYSNPIYVYHITDAGRALLAGED